MPQLYLVQDNYKTGHLRRGRTTPLVGYQVVLDGVMLGRVNSYLYQVDLTPMARTRRDGAPRKGWIASPGVGRAVTRMPSRREAVALVVERMTEHDTDATDALVKAAKVVTD